MQTIVDNSGQLTPTQEKLITALLQYPTIKAAAKVVGIADKTASRYLEMPHFQAAYTQAQQRVQHEVRNGIIALGSVAMNKLAELIDDPECPPAIRLKAAQMVIDRVAPMQSALFLPTTDQQTAHQGHLIDPALAPYLTFEDLDTIEQIVSKATARRAQAEQRKALESV